MENSNILNHTLGALSTYSDKERKHLTRHLFSSGVLTNKPLEAEVDSSKTYLANKKDTREFINCFVSNPLLIKEMERWEYAKDYNYSILYDVLNFSSERMLSEVAKGNLIEYSQLSDFEDLYPVAMKPTYWLKNDRVYLKFNFGLSGYDFNGNPIYNRYNVIIVIHELMDYLEIRYDSLSSQFERGQKNKLGYVKQCLSWSQKFLGIQFQAMDLDEVLNEMKKNGENDGIITTGQDMQLDTGGTATIDIGKNQRMILPFIGELREMLEIYKEEFNEAEVLKNAFEEFIRDKEDLSEFFWMKFNLSDKDIPIKIIIHYNNEDIFLIKHLYSYRVSNLGEERMNYVIEYIVNLRIRLQGEGSSI